MKRIALLLALAALGGCATLQPNASSAPFDITAHHVLRLTAGPTPPAQQVINIGTAPNSGNGDPLRTAFTKDNANVGALFSMFGTSSNLFTSGSALATDIIGLWGGCSGIMYLGADGNCHNGGGGGGSGTVTSVGLTPPAGFTVTPSTITTSGTFAWSGVLAVAAGGTGGSTASTAIANLLPTYVPSDCLASNSGGTALVFVTCGNGAISSVTAGATGLVSVSPTTGAVVVDLANLPAYTIPGNPTNGTAAPVQESMQQLQGALVAVNATLITPTVAGGPVVAWSPTGWGAAVGRICATPSSGGSVIDSWLAGSDGQVVQLQNCESAGGADLIRLVNQSSSDSTAANRFADPGDIIIYAGADAICMYTAGSINRWHCH